MSRRLGRRRGNGGVAAASFTPDARAADLKVWYRMDLGATTGGGNITALADQSGTGDATKDLTSTGTITYTAEDAEFDDQATAAMTGAQRLEGSGNWAAALAQPLTIYWVGKMSGGRIFDGAAGGRCAAIYLAGVVTAYAGTDFVNATGSTPESPHVGCIVFNGASSEIYFDDFTTPAGTGNPGTDALIQMVLGDVGGGGGPLTGKIAEAVAFAGADDATERANMRAYFAARYPSL
jgi:hypothetical protein